MPEDGKLVALDVETQFTSVGEKYWKQAGSVSVPSFYSFLLFLPSIPSFIPSFYSFLHADKNIIIGVDKKIDLRIAPGVETLKKLAEDPNEVGTYDVSFIDADKVCLSFSLQ